MKSSITTLVVTMLLLGSVLVGQNQVCVPQFLDGTAGPFRWETTLILQNQEQSQAQAQLHFYGSDGQPMQGLMMRGRGGHGPHQPVGSNGQFSPGPMSGRGMQSYRSGGQGALQAGFCIAESPDQIQVHSRIHLYDGSGNLLSETSVMPGPQFRSGSFWMDHSEGQGVGLALTNIAPGVGATVTLDLLREDGTSLGSTEVQLGPRSQIARMLVDLFPGILTGEVGYIVITSDDPICALVLQLRGLHMFQIPVAVFSEEVTP